MQMNNIDRIISCVSNILLQIKITYLDGISFVVILIICLYTMWNYGNNIRLDEKVNESFYLRIKNKRNGERIPVILGDGNLIFINFIFFLIAVIFMKNVSVFFEELENGLVINVFKFEASSFIALLGVFATFSQFNDSRGSVIPVNDMLTTSKVLQKSIILLVIILLQCIIGIFIKQAWSIGIVMYSLNLLVMFIYILQLLLSTKNEEKILYYLHQQLWYEKDGRDLFEWKKNNIEKTMDLFLAQFQRACSKMGTSNIKQISYDGNLDPESARYGTLKKRSSGIVAVGLICFCVFCTKSLEPLFELIYGDSSLVFGTWQVRWMGIIFVLCFVIVWVLFFWQETFQITCIMFVYGCCAYEIELNNEKTRYIGKLTSQKNPYYIFINWCKSIYVYFNMADDKKDNGTACRDIIINCCKQRAKNNSDMEILLCMFETIMRGKTDACSIDISDIDDKYKRIADAILNDVCC